MRHIPRVSMSRRLLKDRRVRNLGVAAGIVAAHLAVFAVIGRTQPDGPIALPTPPLDVILYRLAPSPPPPPPPPPTPTRVQGGGAPAAPSRVHTPPPPKTPPPDSPPAPVVQAPEQPLVVGVAPTTSPTPGFGQGGEGNGTGTGVGDGDGPGSGSGPMIIRGASPAEILAMAPPELRQRRRPGRASVNCEIQADTRLSGCRLVEETPSGVGFGPAAIQVVERHFRFRPPRTAGGQPVSGARVTVFVEFGRQR